MRRIKAFHRHISGGGGRKTPELLFCEPLFKKEWALKFIKKIYSSVFCYRIKSLAASKYGLASQPRLVDIIAAVPAAYKKVLFKLFQC